ncbi:MAG TPA: 2-oxoglutarate dehydrogenase complex dihydrolipoyllysine-residue succinyltransferase [Candidatus Limnocylindrales bacterium]|nr:2-oxoglutarate dehydrogenase complex dihydrolipoyllysine-residue succinyltransferase [Candidatus Limnocylindrales bacterium]
MPVEVVVPQLGESVSEGEILRWLKADGESVATDEILLELETDKTTVEIPAPAAGVLRILKQEGATAVVGEVLATIEADGAGAARERRTSKAAAAKAPSAATSQPVKETMAPSSSEGDAPASPAQAAEAEQAIADNAATANEPRLGPAARRVAEERGIDPSTVAATGPGGRVTKSDMLTHEPAAGAASAQAAPAAPVQAKAPAAPRPAPAATDEEERVRMTRLRRTIADRLVQAQHTAAILTTFNEIDMSSAMELRARHKDAFQKAHGIGLGFMSLFARACVLALRDVPVVGARIEGDDIVYSKRVHLGIAASTDRGLVVPVVRNADLMSMADLEREIARLAGLARENKLGIEDLSGGTFTISNGGVFGSLLSTPILNPPQSGILGMHKIEKRPVVVGDQIVVRPMMYVALSYDHRIVDGREAVTFLVRVKERLEDTGRMLLEI